MGNVRQSYVYGLGQLTAALVFLALVTSKQVETVGIATLLWVNLVIDYLERRKRRESEHNTSLRRMPIWVTLGAVIGFAAAFVVAEGIQVGVLTAVVFADVTHSICVIRSRRDHEARKLVAAEALRVRRRGKKRAKRSRPNS